MYLPLSSHTTEQVAGPYPLCVSSRHVYVELQFSNVKSIKQTQSDNHQKDCRRRTAHTFPHRQLVSRINRSVFHSPTWQC